MKRTGYVCYSCEGIVGDNAKTCPHCHAEFDSLLWGRYPQSEHDSSDDPNDFSEIPESMLGKIVLGGSILFLMWIVVSVLQFLGIIS